MQSFVDAINESPVTLELMLAAVERISSKVISNSFEARVLAIVGLFDEPEFAHLDKVELTRSIEFRLEALARLRESSVYKAWAVADMIDGGDFVHHDLLAAAGVEPLQETADGKGVQFNEGSFFDRVLRESDAKGNA